MPLPVPFRRAILCLGLIPAAFLADPRASLAQSDGYRPELGEVEDLFVPADPSAGIIPADAPERTLHPMPAERPRDLLDEVPGKPFADLSSPPRSFAWWKIPVYAVLGAPRDAVDMLFGAAANIPVVNVPVVGLAYEVVPTQLLIRDPRDWHRWPGRRNARGHGWLDSRSWGWFPTARSMKFRYVDEARAERLKKSNEALEVELAALNREIETQGREIARRRREARAAALEALAAGDYREAVARLLPCAESDPSDESVEAMLIDALAAHGDAGPEWVRPHLWTRLAASPAGPLRLAERLLAGSRLERPDSRTGGEALVFARARLGDAAGALAVAREMAAAAPEDARLARLRFEAALSTDDPAESLAALEELDRIGAAHSLDAPRIALLEGRAEEVAGGLEAIARENPEDSRAAYCLAVARLEIPDASGTDGLLRAATAELERLALSTGPRPLRERADQALAYARGIAEAARGPRPRSKKEPAMF